ncbi:hypothetical protein BX600DRAFT_498402 [Xylariales sp. PMI_506]|nr:hypothetical protein BX600DRAFT_498402 [Xylariales sp. PMI_506]
MPEFPLEIAIIGGGLIGLQLAAGLLRRGLSVTVYEQVAVRREIGAGMGFCKSIVDSLRLLNPDAVAALARVGVASGTQMYFANGPTPDQPRAGGYYDFGISLGDSGTAFHRAHFMQAIDEMLPAGVVKLGKRLETAVQDGEDGRIVLGFADGTKAKADAVIGCDGIKSRMREILLGSDHPAARPGYSYQSVYRVLVPMDQAVSVLGEARAKHSLYEAGPGAFLIHYPISQGAVMNVVAYVVDPHDWPAEQAGQLTALASKADVLRAYADWGPQVAQLVDLFPERLERWGLFDTANHPLETFAYGRICLAGDAAHATTPHLGQGASMGVEDSLALATVLEKAASVLQSAGNTHSVQEVVTKAFKVYDNARRERTQWVVQCSRDAGKILTWNDPEIGISNDKIHADFQWRYDEVLHTDGVALVDKCVKELEAFLSESP